MAEVLDALGGTGRYLPVRRQPVTDVRGAVAAELGLVPPLFVGRTMTAMNARRPRPPEELAKQLSEAGELFAHGTVDGAAAADYQRTVAQVSGLPISVVRGAAEVIAEAADQAFAMAAAARPAAAAGDWADPGTRGGRAVWTRRGRTLAVNAAGNHPGVHALWLEALALGYGVAVRPSRREPFTPHRLVSALWEVGLTGADVSFLPTDHSAVDPFLGDADLSLVYGGDDVVRRFSADPRVLPQGPGRSKVLLTGEVTDDALAVAVRSIADQGGTACVNATAVFVERDHIEVAHRIAEQLAALPTLPPLDEAAVLPSSPEPEARRLAAAVEARGRGAAPILPASDMVAPLGDGSAVLRPTLYACDRADAPQARFEMLYPCVWVLPWSRSETAALSDSLVVTAVTEDDELIGELVGDPAIRNVYLGGHPTYWTKVGVPHDGFLGEFLMGSKGVAR